MSFHRVRVRTLPEIKSKRMRLVVCAICITHVVVVAGVSATKTPNIDEVAHLTSRLLIWEQGRYDSYMVNPPLPPLLASAPISFFDYNSDWEFHRTQAWGIGARPEWTVAEEFVRLNAEDVRLMFTIARWACIPFSVCGAIGCWCWSREILDERAATVAVSLWCTSPNVCAWASTLCPDVPEAALGVWA